MDESICVPPEAGLLALYGDDPWWIWAFTCRTPGCSCRTAVVLSTTTGDRTDLLARGGPVRDAWLHGENHASAASKLTDVSAFALDIDNGQVLPVQAANPFEVLDLAAHPVVRAVVDRIDGELLDAIGRLWYRAKGWHDPEEKRRAAPGLEVRGWKAGELLAWNELLEGVRQDFYRIGDRSYEADELYCMIPGCGCGEVVVAFETIRPRGAPHPGRVRIAPSGATEMAPAKKERDRERLELLWDAFSRRHPRYVERFARRNAIMKELGARLLAAAPTERKDLTTKVGRNDDCPCGSGKKFKKCCGAA